MMALAGGGGTEIILTPQTIDDAGPSLAFASYQLSQGDVIAGSAWSTNGTLESFVRPTSAYTLFEAQAVVNSGTSPSGAALSSYLDLNANTPQWYLSQSGAGSLTCNLSVTVREKLNTSNAKTVTVILTATAS